MEVIVAKSAGFCFGVKRAVETVYKQIENSEKPVYTYGPIIHNDTVVNELSEKGVRIIHSEEELDSITEGCVIIRSHGVSRRVQEKMNAQGLCVVDATCPFVKKIHKIVEKAGEEGDEVVILGSESHPEVQGIVGWAKGPVTVINSIEEAEAFTPIPGKNLVIVEQTTFNYSFFKNIIEIFKAKLYTHCYVVETICNATQERQTEAREIAARADAMLVIGGRHSSNTQKLYDICKENCNNTYFIETLVDLDEMPFQSFCSVGITAGASTPNKIIEEVQKKCQN